MKIKQEEQYFQNYIIYVDFQQYYIWSLYVYICKFMKNGLEVITYIYTHIHTYSQWGPGVTQTAKAG